VAPISVGVWANRLPHVGRAIGVGLGRLMLVYIVPNILGSVMILALLKLTTAIIAEANLSFVGLGIPPLTASWGGMISYWFRYLYAASWRPCFRVRRSWRLCSASCRRSCKAA
jgi:ABC-type dipeptide/oligopeptide/nickel transport system permease subunit